MSGQFTTLVVAMGATSPLAGRLAFASVFAALIVWLLLAPASLFDESSTTARPDKTPLWRNTRTWAIAVAAFEMLTYLLWR
ncbi:MAG: hypothetical protein R3E01_35750 [Pirellulaceae bacterium]|nr:hypothetical protein [Planctomycetales bacterium]